jgi:hypothetical protein
VVLILYYDNFYQETITPIWRGPLYAPQGAALLYVAKLMSPLAPACVASIQTYQAPYSRGISSLR